jgi:hypothetical protein
MLLDRDCPRVGRYGIGASSPSISLVAMASEYFIGDAGEGNASFIAFRSDPVQEIATTTPSPRTVTFAGAYYVTSSFVKAKPPGVETDRKV